MGGVKAAGGETPTTIVGVEGALGAVSAGMVFIADICKFEVHKAVKNKAEVEI
jgi:hypothetical protein